MFALKICGTVLLTYASIRLCGVGMEWFRELFDRMSPRYKREENERRRIDRILGIDDDDSIKDDLGI